MRNFLCFLLCIAFSSCEGIVGADGKIFSSDSKSPLGNVRIDFYLNNELQKTSMSSPDGSFRGRDFVGCFPSCPSAKIILSKPGYKTDTIDFDQYWKSHPRPRGSLIIFMNFLK